MKSFDMAGLEDAKFQCGAGSDLHVEPSGGAGGIIVNPTPDNRLASDIATRMGKRASSKYMILLAIKVLVFLFVMQTVLVIANQVI